MVHDRNSRAGHGGLVFENVVCRASLNLRPQKCWLCPLDGREGGCGALTAANNFVAE